MQFGLEGFSAKIGRRIYLTNLSSVKHRTIWREPEPLVKPPERTARHPGTPNLTVRFFNDCETDSYESIETASNLRPPFFSCRNQNSQGNSSATPQANSSNLVQLGVTGPTGSYSVTNKGGAPQLPAPNSRSQANNQSDNPQRHSKLRGANAQGSAAGTLQQIKGNKKSSSRDNTLPSAGINDHHQKQVKPSELSLDLIIPSSIRGAKQSPISGSHA